MISSGDELGRTQQGNNNAYAQDNEISWTNWDLSPEQQALLTYCKELIAFRKAHPIFRRRSFLTGQQGKNICKDVSWWHPKGTEMKVKDWRDPNLSTLGMLLCGAAFYEADAHGTITGDDSFLLIFNKNASDHFVLPKAADSQKWQLELSSSVEPKKQKSYPAKYKYKLEPHVVTVFRGVD